MRGLFVPMRHIQPGYLGQLVEHIDRHHPELTELALTDVTPWDWETIRAVTDGQLPTYYVGATEAPWFGPRADSPPLQPWMHLIAGVAGMMTPSYRWQQIEIDTQAWATAAGNGMDFYVRQEVGIDALGDHPALRAAWEAYLVELARRAAQWRSRPLILWSPYAWDLWGTPAGAAWSARRLRIQSAMSTLVANVRQYSGLGQNLNLVIDLQDGRGAQPAEPATDAANWYNLIKGCGANLVRVNAEWFKGDLTPQDPDVMADRLAMYQQLSIPVGVCWDATKWLLPPPPVPQPIPNHRHD